MPESARADQLPKRSALAAHHADLAQTHPRSSWSVGLGKAPAKKIEPSLVSGTGIRQRHRHAGPLPLALTTRYRELRTR